MRLSPTEVAHITATVQSAFGPQARVWLFGSRVDDSKRGGDVDLYIETPTVIENRLWQVANLNAQLQTLLGEQKIDIVLRAEHEPTLPIHDVALTTGIELT